MMKAFLNDLADWIPIFIFGGIVATISVVGALALVQSVLQSI
jgi:hypothetical protein